jgi:hypothetical protein
MPLLTTFLNKFGLNVSNTLPSKLTGPSNTNTFKHPVQKWMLEGIIVGTQIFVVSETFTVCFAPGLRCQQDAGSQFL